MNRIYHAILLSILPLLTLGIHAQAVEPLQIPEMKVAVWPEYDDPRVFVTYRGKLEPDVPIPAEVSFRVPKGADVQHTCGLTSSEEHQCRLARFTDRDNGLEVSYSVPTREFLIEMYYDPFAAGTVREFEFPFIATYPIQKLDVEVQEPARATSFQVQPTGDTVSSDGQGFEYHRWTYTDVQPQQQLLTKVSYAKDDRKSSVELKQSVASTTSQQHSGGTGGASQAPLIMAIIMTAAIVLALGAYWARTNGSRARSNTRADRRRAQRSDKPQRLSKGQFCPMCGAKVQAHHQFCGDCGAALS